MLIVSPRQQQHRRHADDRQRQRQHDRQRVDERLELRREDQVDEDDREDQRLEPCSRTTRPCLVLARDHDAVAGRQLQRSHATSLTFADRGAERQAVEVAADHDLARQVHPVDLRRRRCSARSARRCRPGSSPAPGHREPQRLRSAARRGAGRPAGARARRAPRPPRPRRCVTACPPTSAPTRPGDRPLSSGPGRPRARGRRSGGTPGVSCSSVASRSTMPGTSYSASFSRCEYSFSTRDVLAAHVDQQRLAAVHRLGLQQRRDDARESAAGAARTSRSTSRLRARRGPRGPSASRRRARRAPCRRRPRRCCA